MQMTKAKLKGYIQYNSNPMTSWIKNKTERDSKSSVVARGWKEGAQDGSVRAPGIFRTVQLLCVLLLLMDTSVKAR